MKPRQKTTMNAFHPCLLFFMCIIEDNDKPPHSFSSSIIQKKKNSETQKRTMSFPSHHCPLQPKKNNLDVGFSWVARDDDRASRLVIVS
jgi:hypothetical protein